MNKKNGYSFRISVTRLSDNTEGDPVAEDASLTFDASSHDDILMIAERVRGGTRLSEADANALAIGLKLFSGVMLKHRSDPAFKAVEPAMRDFIKSLKAQVSAPSNDWPGSA